MRRSRWGRAGLVGLLFLALTSFYTYPLAVDLSATLLIGLGDYLAESATVAWNAHQLLRDPLHLADSPFYYPDSQAIVHQQPAVFTGVLAAPVLALTGQALLASNVLLFLSFVASGILAYMLADTLTARALPSVLAGIVFAYFPNRMDHLGQFTYQMGALLPLAIWAVYRFLLEGRWRDLALLAAALWAQTLSSLYNAFGLGLLLLGLTATVWLLRPDRCRPRLLARALVGGLALAAALAPFLAPYWAAYRELGREREVDLADWFGMDLLSLFDPGVFNRLYGGHLLSLGRSEGGLFPGFVVLGLVIVAAWSLRGDGSTDHRPRWARITTHVLGAAGLACGVFILAAPLLEAAGLRRRLPGGLRPRHLTLAVNVLPLLALVWVGLEGTRRAARGPLTAREWTVALAFLSMLTYLTTLAPTLMIADQPWGVSLLRWIHLYVPGAAAFRAPGRWSLAFALSLALLAAFGLRALQDSLHGRWPATVSLLLLGGLVVEYNVHPLPWSRLSPTPPVYEWLAREPGDFAVIELPIDSESSNGWAMFWGTRHWKRLVNGHGGFSRDTVDTLVQASNPFDGQTFAEALRTIVPLRYVVIHRAAMDAVARRRWEAIRTAPLPGLPFVRSFGEDDVYELAGTPDTGTELRRQFSTSFVRTRSHLEYRIRLGRAEPEVSRWVAVVFNGRPLGRITTDGPGRLILQPPYRASDRNELEFRHEYSVLPRVTETARYLIGTTGAQSPVDLHVTSGAKFVGNTASIRVNGHEALTLSRRGYNVVALDGRDGRILASDNFDTFKSAAESRRMAALIDALVPGSVVVGAIRDDGGGQLEADGVRALRSIGGQADLRGRLWTSHLLVGVKGAPPGTALEAEGPRLLTASVGRDRSLDVTLETLEFR